MTEDELFEDVKYWKARADAATARAERLRLELEKIGWMDEFLDAQGAKWMMEIARKAVNADEGPQSLVGREREPS